MPAVIGWDWHQRQQRVNYSWAVTERRRQVDDFYRTGSITEEMLDPATLAPVVVFLASELGKELNGRVLLAHGGTIGVKITEFRMQMNDGYNTREGIPTPQQIAQNIDQVLFEGPDLQIGDSMKFD